MLLHHHHVPGRLRVALARLKGDRAGAELLRQALLALTGVTAVSISPAIGSVTLHYASHEFSPEAFWETLRRLRLIGDAPEPAPVRAAPIAARPLVDAAADALAAALVETIAQRLFGPAGGVLARLLG